VRRLKKVVNFYEEKSAPPEKNLGYAIDVVFLSSTITITITKTVAVTITKITDINDNS